MPKRQRHPPRPTHPNAAAPHAARKRTAAEFSFLPAPRPGRPSGFALGLRTVPADRSARRAATASRKLSPRAIPARSAPSFCASLLTSPAVSLVLMRPPKRLTPVMAVGAPVSPLGHAEAQLTQSANTRTSREGVPHLTSSNDGLSHDM